MQLSSYPTIRKYQIEKIRRIESFGCKRSEQKFYITFSKSASEYKYGKEFEFNIGRTNRRIEKRIYEHKLEWGARLENTIFIDAVSDDFILCLETYIKRKTVQFAPSNRSRTEFRLGIGCYALISNMLFDIAKENPDQRIIFYLPESRNLFFHPLNTLFVRHFMYPFYEKYFTDHHRLFHPDFLVKKHPAS